MPGMRPLVLALVLHACLARAPASHPDAQLLQGLKVTFESCQASLAARGPRAKTLASPRWMHIPKAGTSFAAVLYAYTCANPDSPNYTTNSSGKPCFACGADGAYFWPPLLRSLLPFGELSGCESTVELLTAPRSHRSFKRHSDGHVGLFREPRARLVSAYNYNKHSFGIQTRRAFVRKVKNFHDYINTDAIHSCSTKMLLGRMCATPMNVSRSDAERALANLRQFAFVGLTEAYNASVCLFHHMHGGDIFPFEFAYVREAPPYDPNEDFRLPGGSKRVPPSSWKSLSEGVDPYDAMIYREARSMFVIKLREYGLLPAEADTDNKISS